MAGSTSLTDQPEGPTLLFVVDRFVPDTARMSGSPEGPWICCPWCGAEILLSLFAPSDEEPGAANQMQYVLTSATCKGGFENNTRDGQVRVRWEGLTCEETSL